MTYYPTLDEDLARAKEILAKANEEILNSHGDVLTRELLMIDGSDSYAAYKLLESFVAEIEKHQQNRRMFISVLRRALVVFANVSEDWDGSVGEALDLMNAHVERVGAYIERLRADAEAHAQHIASLRVLNDQIQQWIDENPVDVPDGLGYWLDVLDIGLNGPHDQRSR